MLVTYVLYREDEFTESVTRFKQRVHAIDSPEGTEKPTF
jgi:hypothetical protein